MASVGQEGPAFSPDGKFLFEPVAEDRHYPLPLQSGRLARGAGTKISIPTAGTKQALTAGI